MKETVLHRLENWAKEAPGAVAQRYKENGEWKGISAREFRDRVHHLALFLQSRGLGPGAIGCILSPNNPQWVHADLAILLTGARSAGLYPNSTSKDILYILNHTEAKFLAVKDREFFNKIVDESGKSAVPEAVDFILVLEGDTSFSPKAISYKNALAEGEKLAKAAGAKSFAELLKPIDADAGAFLIYTSGTTGNPKGALLSHDNLAYTADLAANYWKLPFARGSLFSFLPLCHIAEKIQNVGVGISQRYTVSFATKFENVATELPEVQPSLLLCVPRLWEKMMEGVMHKVEGGKGLKKHLAQWALGTGKRIADAKFTGRIANPLDVVQMKVADKVVLAKVRQALGLGKAELLASGAAALPGHVSKWFRSLDLEILEDFGQTESTGVICMTEPGVESAGTVGKPVPGVDFKIAEDGEIITRGRHVFKGYFKDDAATASTLIDGWLHTGDLAEITPKGLVRIKGRKKEVLKTSGGKMVAPLPIEEKIKAAPAISQVCVVGDGRKYLSALVTLSEARLNQLRSKNSGIDGKVVTDSEILSEVRRAVDEVNHSLAGFEQIKKFMVLSKEFSIEEGEMTPTLKMKRNVIEKRYSDVIDQMYS